MANVSAALAEYFASGKSDPGAVADGWQPACATASDRLREDNVWMMTSAVLVLSMNAAFALLEAGCVSSKNVLNIMMKNIGDLTLGGVVWWAFGYVIAFPSTAKWGTTERFPSYVHDEPFWFFQWTFAATAATIDSGALAERVNFVSYCVLSTLVTGVVYPVVVSWAWDSAGFLATMDPPYMDYAGGTVVHLLGAATALVSCIMVGPRIGRFQDYAPSTNFLSRVLLRRSLEADYYMVPPGAVPIKPVTDGISMIWGVFFLWIGWYGFNPGGVGEIEGSGTYVVGRITVNTTMGALGGGALAFVIEMVLHRGKVRPESLALGVLSGLVSITAGCYWFSNGSSMLIGALGALISMAAKRALEAARIDDVVTAIPIHGACGAFGAIAIPFWAEPWGCSGGDIHGFFYAENDEQREFAWKLLQTQLLGCAVIVAWTMCATFVILSVLNQIPGLRCRVGRNLELVGADELEHSMTSDITEFQFVMKAMLQGLVASSGEPATMMRIFNEALQCLSVTHKLRRLKAHNPEESDCELIVDIVKVNGLEALPRTSKFSAAKKGYFAQAQIVSAEEVAPGSGSYHTCFNYLAPRTTSIKDLDPQAEDGRVLDWSFEPLVFQKFYLPPGSEVCAFVYASIFAHGAEMRDGKARPGSGSKIWEAYIPLRSAGWTAVRNSTLCHGQAHLGPCGHRSAACSAEGATLVYQLTIPDQKSRFSSRVSRMRSGGAAAATPRTGEEGGGSHSWPLGEARTELPTSMEGIVCRVRDLEARMEKLTVRNEALEARNQALEQRMDKLSRHEPI